MAEKTVAEQVQELTEKWNPPPTDHTLERLVGVPTDPADVAATAHVPMEELNRHMSPTDSNVDAQRLQEFTDDGDDDGDDDKDGKELKGKALDEALEARGLPKTGSADEKRERVRAFDAGDDGDDGESEGDKSDDEDDKS